VVGADGDTEAMHHLIETGRGGMGFFADWCDCQRDNNDGKALVEVPERENGRTAIAHELPDLIRSHYDHRDRIAQDIRDLGRRLSNPPETLSVVSWVGGG
jgi:hypothetical protein